MAKWPRSTATVITADDQVTTFPAWLHSVSVNVSSAGGDVVIYEGQDATSGRKLAHIDAAAAETNLVSFNPPLWCERGIYVDVGSNVTEVMVHYTPQRRNQPDVERE